VRALSGHRKNLVPSQAPLACAVAAVLGAEMNVDANLASIGDAAYLARASAERQHLTTESGTDAGRGLALVAKARVRR
jgi:formiminotetrahydrofolate cyclodeaminase